jgi:hypothetical protein
VGLVALYDDADTMLAAAHGDNDNERKIPRSWDLTHYQGKKVKLLIADDSASGDWGYLGCSGFDLITSYNGP